MRIFVICAAFCVLAPFIAYAADQQYECAHFDNANVQVHTQGEGANLVQKLTLDLHKGEDSTLKQISSASNEVIRVVNGEMEVTSYCGTSGKIGTITICSIGSDGKETACGTKIPKDKNDLIDKVTAAASSANPQGALKNCLSKRHTAKWGI